jgi:hypothetical protein
MFPDRMPELPARGSYVGWRDPRHAQALAWESHYGPGPFEVVDVLDKSDVGLPAGILLKTNAGERDISEVWLTAVAR